MILHPNYARYYSHFRPPTPPAAPPPPPPFHAIVSQTNVGTVSKATGKMWKLSLNNIALHVDSHVYAAISLVVCVSFAIGDLKYKPLEDLYRLLLALCLALQHSHSVFQCMKAQGKN